MTVEDCYVMQRGIHSPGCFQFTASMKFSPDRVSTASSVSAVLGMRLCRSCRMQDQIVKNYRTKS